MCNQDRISIVGLGQMGASLGLSLKKKGFWEAPTIVGIARRKETLRAALNMHAIDVASLDLRDVKGSSEIFICTPVDTIVPIYKELCEFADRDSVITDVGSVKYPIEQQINSLNCRIPFVGSNPMVGNERSGITSACADMFKEAKVVVTGGSADFNPGRSRNQAGISKIEGVWGYAGANVIRMTAKDHDELVAFTSHLSHIIAFALNKTYEDIKKERPQIENLIAGSFRSMTRVAASSADIWAPIFASNSENINKCLDEFIEQLFSFQAKLKNEREIKGEIIKSQGYKNKSYEDSRKN